MARISWLFGLLGALALGACNQPNVVFDEFVEVSDNRWNADSLAVFRTSISDTTACYDVFVQVRNDNSYAYQNLWLFIDVFAPNGVAYRDTFGIELAEPDGTWIGGGWGSLYSLKAPFRRNFRFTEPGPYTFRLSHGMRTESLRGLRNVGLLIQESQNGKE